MPRLAALGARLLESIAAALLDNDCAGCGAWTQGLLGPACGACRELATGPVSRMRCGSCSTTVKAGGRCPACAARAAWPRVVAPHEHAGLARSLVHSLKYGRRREVAALLAEGLARDESVLRALEDADVVVPVPAAPARRLERGFNQADDLAIELVQAAGRRGLRRRLVRALRRRGGSLPQVGQDARTRRAAMARAFGPSLSCRWRALTRRRPALAGLRVVLVDDVVTTGSTARAAARSLRRLGARDVVIVAVTRSGRRAAGQP